jgi:hypothetical protein
MSKYIYNARLSKSCRLLAVEPLVSIAKNAAEMIITSHYYPTYDECLNQLQGLMHRLCALLNKVSDEQFIVVSKFRDRDEEKVEFADKQVARLYVAKAKEYKETEEILYSISAHISLSNTI